MRVLAFTLGILSIGNALPDSGAANSITKVDSKLTSRNILQDLVTWDKNSLIVRGERIMLLSGEFHPFRLPVPGLWLDIFQKIKALGFTGVSFYTDWGLLEGSQGQVVTDGIWSLDEFFDAAKEAGIYLIARPGPYINAETSAGGIPGWVLRIKSQIRSDSEEYLNTMKNYVSTIGKIIADAEITKGGPVILMQPENEYTTWPGVTDFPSTMNREYMSYVEQQFRDAGVTVPFIDNDNEVEGYFAPRTGLGAVDLYGIDSYPMRYDCTNPYVWPTYRFPYNWQTLHQNQSPTTPFAIAEFQGGSGEGWGGVTQDNCAILVNEEAERVVYKNNYAFHATIFNIYMTYGGTNWGNLGYEGGYTSYDYGAAITENRELWREKYSELKLQANFLKASPAYLTATPGLSVNGTYGVPDTISVTSLTGDGTNTNFYVVRHGNFTSVDSTRYRLSVSTSIGNVTIPQLGGSLTLNGRDSKIHVADYDIAGINMIYSSAEVFTWAKGIGTSRVLILYGGEGENHEAAFPSSTSRPQLIEGSGVFIVQSRSSWVLKWQVSTTRKVLKIDDLYLYLVWRNEAYNYWVLELPAANQIGNFTSSSKERVIVSAGYLIRSSQISGDNLALTGDVNATTRLEILSAPAAVNSITFNGSPLPISKTQIGNLAATVHYHCPDLQIPNLSQLQWKFVDSLPEIQPSFNDSPYRALTHTSSNNPLNLSTPMSLYAMDYGYHAGSFIYRGHFTANSLETTACFNISGGVGFGHSIWLNQTFLGSWPGAVGTQIYNHNLTFPSKLVTGEPYVLTVLIDHMGYDEEAPGTDAIKFPRGILNYHLSGHSQADVDWRMTGNLGGEQYIDLTRGPLNEGSFYAERQGYHLPRPPDTEWKTASPVKDGIGKAAVGLFTTSFDLDIPSGWDVPMSFVFNAYSSGAPRDLNNTHQWGNNYRCQLFVNGYQFGKYVNNLGPQTKFPVPEGILNHNGINYIALTLWALDKNGAKIDGLELVSSRPIFSGYRRPKSAPQPAWEERLGAY